MRGLQVSPSELDAVLLSHPDVADASVVGVYDKHSGEVPRAFVVKKSGASATEAQIADYVRGKQPSILSRQRLLILSSRLYYFSTALSKRLNFRQSCSS